MAYTTAVDVANRACQHLGVPRIASFTESSKQAKEIGFVYDKLRAAELQRVIWTFAVRPAMMRKMVSTTDTVNFATYAAGTTYAVGDIVQDSSGYLWISIVASNIGNTPGAGGAAPSWISYAGPVTAQAWSGSVAYVPGDIIYTSSVVYICVLAHTNHAQPNATYWHVIAGATLTSGIVASIISPLGYKPDASAIKGIYRLPANYLRMAAQDPKNPAGVQLNVTAAMRYNDWEIKNGFLLTNDTEGFVLQFVADQTDVTVMENIFCEVWAARIAIELCETITQSAEKLNNLIGLYTRYTNIARMINAIEGGSSEDEQLDTPPAQPQGR
jgi:hypothetical protein